jgi:hypothetical protein
VVGKGSATREGPKDVSYPKKADKQTKTAKTQRRKQQRREKASQGQKEKQEEKRERYQELFNDTSEDVENKSYEEVCFWVTRLYQQLCKDHPDWKLSYIKEKAAEFGQVSERSVFAYAQQYEEDGKWAVSTLLLSSRDMLKTRMLF